MVVIVFGSRGFDNPLIVNRLLQPDLGDAGLVVVTGGARGADNLGAVWARKHKIVHLTIRPEWDVHDPEWCAGDCPGSRQDRPYCSLAGFKRNQAMVDEALRDPGRSAAGYGFLDRPLSESKGSYDMAKRCRVGGITTYLIEKWS